MMILYGTPQSRASRCIWMLEELRIEYELVPIPDTSDENYLAMNPNGKVPCLLDGSITLWESMAINLYLALSTDSPLSPTGKEELAGVLKWTLWSQSELEEYFNHIDSLESVDPDWMRKTFGVLESSLTQSTYLIGDRFTVADLNVCAMFLGPVSSKVSLEDYPQTTAWCQRNYAREAAQATLGISQII